jgi:hypothetical protein
MKETNNYLKPAFSALHFKRDGKWYARVINKQILQAMNFQSFSDGKEFTVNLEIIPLCWKEITDYKHAVAFGIGSFLGSDKWWTYHNRQEAWDLVKEKVIPVFESISDYGTLYQALKPFIHNRPTELTGYYAEELSLAIGGLPLFWLCVALGEIEDARACIIYEITRLRTAYQTNLEHFEKDIADTIGSRYHEKAISRKDDYHNTMDKNIGELESLYDLLDNDVERLLALSTSHAEKSLAYLNKYAV